MNIIDYLANRQSRAHKVGTSRRLWQEGGPMPCCLQKFIQQFWDEGRYLTMGKAEPVPHYDLPWVAYEDYMQAQLVDVTPGKPSTLIISFPANSSEDQCLHVHPISDRAITVLQGTGDFLVVRDGKLLRHRIGPGNQIWMPRGGVPNFIAGPEGLTVESHHLPFVPFDDPQCFVRWEGELVCDG